MYIYLGILLLLTVLFIGVSIYTLFTKKYEYFFVALYPVLPNYYALEISNKLPLLTARRVMILFLIVYVLSRIKFRLPKFEGLSKPSFLLLLSYFVLRLLSNFYYIFSLTEAIKTIFSICFEEILLLILFACLFTSQEKIEKAINCVIYTSFAVFSLAILESFCNINFGTVLYTVQRDLLNKHSIRLGMLRSVLTFGIPSFFATYCILLLPLIVYMYCKHKKISYLAILSLDILALIHSGCRAQQLILIVCLPLLVILSKKEMRKDLLQKVALSLLATLSVILVLCLCSPKLNYFYTGTAKSLLNVVGFNFDLSSNAPEGVTGFGSNEDGTYSRVVQFSGIPYTLSINPLFGLGSGAQNRRAIQYYWNNNWCAIATYDVGYVAIIGNEGLIGLAAYVCLLVGSLLVILRKKDENNILFFKLFFLYLICLFANDLLDHVFWLIYSLFIAYNLRTNVLLSSEKE